MTTARLGHHHVRWLRDLAEREGDVDLVRTCDVAMAGGSMGASLRDVRVAQKRCVDAINARTGYTQERARIPSRPQVAADVRAIMARLK